MHKTYKKGKTEAFKKETGELNERLVNLSARATVYERRVVILILSTYITHQISAQEAKCCKVKLILGNNCVAT